MIQIKRLAIIFLLSTTLLEGYRSDKAVMRVAVLSNFGSLIFMYIQEDNTWLTPFENNFSKPGISLYFGGELGSADRALVNKKFSLAYPWKKNLYENDILNLSGKTEFTISRYKSSLDDTMNSTGYIYTILPMFIYSFKSLKFFNSIPYMEVGVGYSLMDHTIVENRDKSTKFQFNDNIGFGLMKSSYKIGYRFTHISNLGIKKPNPGLDFHQLSLSYEF